MKLQLQNVTLFGADTVDLDRILLAFEICMKYADFAAVKVVADVPEDYVTESGIQVFTTNKINSISDYSQFIFKDTNNYIDTDFVLIAQHDGFILNPDAWQDDFLNYDYIGAPWPIDGELVSGNGGFSIRSKKLLELTQSDDVIKVGNINDHKYAENEDWILCVVLRKYLEEKGISFAPGEIARKFSIESNDIVGRKWTDQFGFHGLRWTDISAWLTVNPEYKIDNPLDLE